MKGYDIHKHQQHQQYQQYQQHRHKDIWTPIIPGTVMDKKELLLNKLFDILSKKDYNNNITIDHRTIVTNNTNQINYKELYTHFWAPFFSSIKSTLQTNEQINKLLKVCTDYDTAVTNAFTNTNNDLKLIFNLINDFMCRFSDIVVLTGIASMDVKFVHYIVTAMKRWDRSKSKFGDYLVDPVISKYYKFIMFVEKTLDKYGGADFEKILDLLLVFIDVITNDSSIDNDILAGVMDFAISTKSITLVDIFRDKVDIKSYAIAIGHDEDTITKVSSSKLIKLSNNKYKF